MVIINGTTSKALAISAWLKSKGLVHGQDYTWHSVTADKKIVFSCRDSKWETIIVLKHDS